MPSRATSSAAAPSAAAPAPAPRSFAALRHRDYRVYFIATAAAMMADNIEHVISYWVLFERFHSPTLGGVAVLTHWLPFLFFSVYSGALADRYDQRRLIQGAMALFMIASLGWAVLFATGTLQAWHTVVLLTIHGIAGVLWGPASQLLIHEIVGREHLQSAVRLNATSRNLGMLMGPAVGGGLMMLLGPAGGLLANVLIYVPLMWWLSRVPYGSPAHRSARAAEAPRTAWAHMLHALRIASGNRTVMSMIVLAGVSSFLVGNAFQAQMPEYAHDLGTGHADLSYSVLFAANAAGALAGGIVLESRGLLQARAQTAILFALLWSFAIGGFALARNYALAVALMFAAGFLNLAYSAMAQTLVQLHAPGELRGRLVGLFNMSNNGLRAFSGVTVGFLGSLIGIHASLALSAAALLAITVALFAFAMRGRAGY